MATPIFETLVMHTAAVYAKASNEGENQNRVVAFFC